MRNISPSVVTVSIFCIYLMKKKDEKSITVEPEPSLDWSHRMAPRKKKKILLSPSPPRHVPSPGEEPGTDPEQLAVGSLVRADKLTLTQRSRIMQMASPQTTTCSLLVENFQPAFTESASRETRRSGGDGRGGRGGGEKSRKKNNTGRRKKNTEAEKDSCGVNGWIQNCCRGLEQPDCNLPSFTASGQP